MRRLYAKIMRNELGAQDPRSWAFWIHSGNGGIDMTREPLELNQARSAISTLAMALSGSQSIGGATYDEPLGIPGARASHIAILTRYLVAHECGVMDTVDPLAGSYYVEHMTSEIERRAAEEIKRIDEMGGMLAAVKKGYVQAQITENAFREQRRIERGEKVTIGLNMFVEHEQEERRNYYKPNPKVLASQTAKIQRLKATRDNEKVEAALNKLREYASKPESDENNLVPHVMDAVKAYATIGEIAGVLRGVFGEYQRLVSF
jgi:methylmalonyl-CoA mutase N-terminal domain/subunit